MTFADLVKQVEPVVTGLEFGYFVTHHSAHAQDQLQEPAMPKEMIRGARRPSRAAAYPPVPIASPSFSKNKSKQSKSRYCTATPTKTFRRPEARIREWQSTPQRDTSRRSQPSYNAAMIRAVVFLRREVMGVEVPDSPGFPRFPETSIGIDGGLIVATGKVSPHV